MSHNYLTEAFKELKILDEDTFSFSDKGAEELKKFMDNDTQDDLEVIIDPAAKAEEDLEDSYVGKVVLKCDICQSLIYKDPSEVILDEESGLANVGEDCPYCQTADGFKIAGQVGEYKAQEETEEKSAEENEEKIEESLTEAKRKPVLDPWEQIYGELAMDGEQKKTAKGVPYFNRGAGYNYSTQVRTDRDGNIIVYGETEEELDRAVEVAKRNGCPYEVKPIKSAKGRFKYYIAITVPEVAEAAIASNESVELKNSRTSLKEAKARKLQEEVQRAEVETDKEIVTVAENENGKVTVETTPKSTSEGETIQPVSDEVKTEIETSTAELENEYDDVEIDEFDEEEFDELGESYLKEVYDNVTSYKTIKGYVDGNKLKLEGVIAFVSGKKVKTNFIFESKYVTKTGKLKFLGENKEISPKKKSYTLTGKMDGKKLIIESLTYNYRGKDSKSGQTQPLYGTVKKSK